MKTFTCVKTVVASLLLASAAVVWALPPAFQYGTSTTALANGPIAITTTVPTSHNPRAAYVVAAEANTSNDLEVIAWQDTTTKLVKVGTPGVVQGPGLFSVAIAGLDSGRVVTADIDFSGTLSIDTWTVGPGGVVKQNGTSTGAEVAYHEVSIVALSSTEVVTAYQQLGDSGASLAVEAWTIAADGLPTAEKLIGSGPEAFEVSIAAVSSNQVVTAINDGNQLLALDTWGVDSAGVHFQEYLETGQSVSRLAEDVGIGAGGALKLVRTDGFTHLEWVQSAVTPIINFEGNVVVFNWQISETGGITQENTPVSSASNNNFEVTACMLPQNVPITSYGNDDGYVKTGVYGYTAATYSATPPTVNTDGISWIAAAAAGTDFNVLNPYAEYDAYFVTAVNTYYGSSDDGTLEIRKYAYALSPII